MKKFSITGVVLDLLYALLSTYSIVYAMTCSGLLCGVGFELFAAPWVFTIPTIRIVWDNDVFITLFLFGVAPILNILLLYLLGQFFEKRWKERIKKIYHQRKTQNNLAP